jgi:hypothetical protein
MLVLANEMFDSPPVFAWVLPVFVRLKPGKEETFFSASWSRIFLFFPRGRRSKRRQTMKGPGVKGRGKPGRGKGKGKGGMDSGRPEKKLPPGVKPHRCAVCPRFERSSAACVRRRCNPHLRCPKS